MEVAANGLVLALAVNLLIAFARAFYWQSKVILLVLGTSDRQADPHPWKALANQNSALNMLGRFVAGKFAPDLRRKWCRAIGYCAVSALCLMIVVGLCEAFVPDLMW